MGCLIVSFWLAMVILGLVSLVGTILMILWIIKAVMFEGG